MQGRLARTFLACFQLGGLVACASDPKVDIGYAQLGKRDFDQAVVGRFITPRFIDHPHFSNEVSEFYARDGQYWRMTPRGRSNGRYEWRGRRVCVVFARSKPRMCARFYIDAAGTVYQRREKY